MDSGTFNQKLFPLRLTPYIYLFPLSLLNSSNTERARNKLMFTPGDRERAFAEKLANAVSAPPQDAAKYFQLIRAWEDRKNHAIVRKRQRERERERERERRVGEGFDRIR